MVNLSSVVESVIREPRIDILCAGTDGEETLEDLLTAGAMIDRLTVTPLADWQLNDAATSAVREWRLLVGKADLSGARSKRSWRRSSAKRWAGAIALRLGMRRICRSGADRSCAMARTEMDVTSGRITVPA